MRVRYRRYAMKLILIVVLISLAVIPAMAQQDSGTVPDDGPGIEAGRTNSRTAKPAAVGLYIGLGPAIAGLDLRVGKVYGYLSGSLLLPLVYNHLKVDLAFGVGPTFRFFSDNWSFTVFGTTQLDMEGINKLDLTLAIGAGLGWRFVHPKGFTLGFKLPFLGYAIPILSPSNFWDLNDNAMRVAYYYFTFAKAVPVVSIGYTF